MSLIWNGMMEGLGKGLAGMGAQWAQNEQRLEEIRLRAEERRQENLEKLMLQAELTGLRVGRSGSGSGSSGDPVKAAIADYIKSNVSSGPTDRAAFEQKYEPTVAQDELGNEIKGYTNFDKEGYAKAEKERFERDVGLINRLASPAAWNEVQQGEAQRMVNEIIAQANSTDDPKLRKQLIEQAGLVSKNAFGKDTIGVSPDGIVYNKVDGSTSETPVSKAEVKRLEGAAARDNAQARENDRTDPNRGRGGGGGGKPATDPTQMTNDQINRAIDVQQKILAKSKDDETAKESLRLLQAELRKRLAGSGAPTQKPSGSPGASGGGIDYSKFMKR